MTLEDLLAKNKQLQNIHSGRRCFIIGNGPSIATQDLKYLQNEICIVVSAFHRHPDAKTINPLYWVMADPTVWGMAETFFFPLLQRVNDIGQPTKLFLPTGGFNFLSGVNTGSLIDHHYFHYDHIVGIDTVIDFTKGIPPYGQNVIIVCLMLAYFLGCNPICFIGCDHDFMKTTQDEYEGRAVKHFYSEKNAPEPSSQMPWDEWQRCMVRMDFEYNLLKDYASRWGFNVFNATKGGCLEYFPRVEYESLFPQKSTEPVINKQILTADIYNITNTAVNLINVDNYSAALVLLDEAIRNNINRSDRAEGLFYLKAICLFRLSRHIEALQYARQDYVCNPSNQHNCAQLIQHLEKFLNK